jgi:hypothetical protein
VIRRSRSRPRKEIPRDSSPELGLWLVPFRNFRPKGPICVAQSQFEIFQFPFLQRQRTQRLICSTLRLVRQWAVLGTASATRPSRSTWHDRAHAALSPQPNGRHLDAGSYDRRETGDRVGAAAQHPHSLVEELLSAESDPQTTSALELGRLWDEHDLTSRSGLEDLLVRARCLGE